jgi:hypothetical protein
LRAEILELEAGLGSDRVLFEVLTEAAVVA